MNVTRPFTGCGGSGRSVHVSPRSVERKSRVPATKAHTTVPLGAERSVKLGSGMRVGVGDSAGVRVAVGTGVGVGVAAATVADGLGDAAGWAPHAVRTITKVMAAPRITPAGPRATVPARPGRARHDP